MSKETRKWLIEVACVWAVLAITIAANHLMGYGPVPVWGLIAIALIVDNSQRRSK